MKKSWDQTILFVEKYGLRLIMVIIVGVVLGIKLFLSHKIDINNFMSYFLEKKEGTFINIAAIFIGISFAIFTILGSTRPGSIISKLKESNLQQLIKFLRNGLFGGFAYILLTLFFVKDSTSAISQYFNIFLFTSLIYMLLSSLRFGMYLVFVIYDDVNGLFNKIKDAEVEENKKNQTLIRLDSFLDEYESLKRGKRTEKIRDIFKQQSDNQKN